MAAGTDAAAGVAAGSPLRLVIVSMVLLISLVKRAGRR